MDNGDQEDGHGRHQEEAPQGSQGVQEAQGGCQEEGAAEDTVMGLSISLRRFGLRPREFPFRWKKRLLVLLEMGGEPLLTRYLLEHIMHLTEKGQHGV